ncbi:hypothetical protein CHARACLAT_017828 [Characodon lateralis]|uniref:Uncharacterized protein n=1 Tax=Characodon lateralis TaxID=208331 RepID=A0ABU7DTS1_9TELE|nr:hypothetical protein [Characodon lateralis]
MSFMPLHGHGTGKCSALSHLQQSSQVNTHFRQYTQTTPEEISHPPSKQAKISTFFKCPQSCDNSSIHSPSCSSHNSPTLLPTMENSAPSLLRARHLQAAKLTYHQVTCFDLGCERGNTPPGCTRLTLVS